MSARESALVDQAFRVLDVDKSGAIQRNDIIRRFEDSDGDDTADAIGNFLAVFDGNGDGTCTKSEFYEYYLKLRQDLPSEEYFCYMMCQCWKISEMEPSAQDLLTLVREKIAQKVCAVEAKEPLKKAFKFFDRDGSGFVDGR